MSASPRARALGKELRAAREAAGLTMRELGARLGWSEAKISRLETARRGIRPESVAAILDALGISGQQRQRLMELAREVRTPGWWRSRDELPYQLSALIDAETRATRITNVALNLLPGLLQTPSYAREVMRAAGVSGSTLEDRLELRLARQRILSRPGRVDLRIFVDEVVLLRPVGGPAVMAEQLRHVLSVSGKPNVQVRVLPLEIGAHAGLSGAFVLFDFVAADPLVYLEARRAGAFIDCPADVEVFSGAVGLLDEQALSAAASRAVLRRHLDRFEGADGKR
ncbi:helix-turn-helix domain-containing protein [Saccharopolyspora rectivirgula]|jgi:transcriptional regulator with XRE-family HTH domain|uniref:HTH cro/C1-type domain-containing protein n=1 Tax=Saccharopolyspora rectivirgula TaxID=28042 RepID=A0A073BBR4_9PSEU|nr:helix-turn-helix transcriptional regulator [Saccharopolyspora rectivirgula]KEI45179.1 hypothetical protein GU90_05180 [Saccharopolyspora rectivirgula]